MKHHSVLIKLELEKRIAKAKARREKAIKRNDTETARAEREVASELIDLTVWIDNNCK